MPHVVHPVSGSSCTPRGLRADLASGSFCSLAEAQSLSLFLPCP